MEIEPVDSVESQRKIYYASGGAFRIIGGEDEGLYFKHGDHLGSTSVLSDSTGAKVVDSDVLYAPFGEVRTGTLSELTDFGFTGQILDRSSGNLMYYGARYYLPGLRRFISADTIMPNPDNSQDFNRYSYTRNNPVKYTDPTGHEPEPYTDEWWVWQYYAKVDAGLIDPTTGEDHSGDVTVKPSGVEFDTKGNSGNYAPGIPQDTSDPNNRRSPGTEIENHSFSAQVMEDGNWNACGIVALAQIYGVDAATLYEEAKTLYKDDYWDEKDQVMKNGLFRGTSSWDLNRIVQNFDYLGGWVGSHTSDDLEQDIRISMEVIDELYIMPLVTIDGSVNGGPLLPAGDSSTKHWVVVTGISSQNDWDNGSQWVEVYNPFHNQTEYYTWEDFTGSLKGEIAVVLTY